MFFIATTLARLIHSGGFGWFVQQHMKIPLIVATAVLLVFSLYEAVAAAIEMKHNPNSSRHPAGPVIGWLMALPMLVVVSVAPTGLGAAAASRVETYTPTDNAETFAALDPTNGPVEMRVSDFLRRALWDEAQSLDNVPVRLVGIVVNDPELGKRFRLTRFFVSCCAADGLPLQVVVPFDDQPLADDTWVSVELTWVKPSVPFAEYDRSAEIEADVISITVLDTPPTEPYESPYS